MTQNNGTIEINARFYMRREHDGWCVRDRLQDNKHVFCNGSEQDCREWVERNCVEPKLHAPAPWTREGNAIYGSEGFGLVASVGGNAPDEDAANAALIVTSPKTLALLKRYHEAMPTPESGQLILEAEGWAL
jgi:hypothetical protein